MRDYLTLGPTPACEECEQVGPNFNASVARKEMRAYINQLKRQFGEDTQFGIKSFPHDFGSYSEVVVYYNPDNEKEMEAAFNVESNLPENWDNEARRELAS